MIKTENGDTEVLATSPKELFGDILHILTTFVAYSKAIGVPNETIEKTLVQMIVDAFNESDTGELFDFSGKE